MSSQAPAKVETTAPVPTEAHRRTTVGDPVLGLLLLGAGVLLVAVLACVDITQGTANVGTGEVWKALTGRAGPGDASVVVASRLPRMVAGLLVGAALGVAGAAMQAVSRNVLAAPDTLAVSAGAYLALGVVTVTGLQVPLIAESGAAFVGGLAAAAVVLAVSGLGTGTVRLVLAGSALALGLSSVTDGLLLLYPESTAGLYQWSQGSISQNGFDGVLQMLPVVAIAVAGFLLISRRVDALALGDDASRGLGVSVRSTRVVAVLLAVLLSAASVTLAGPVGFVGLCAPAVVRPLRRRFRALTRSWASFPVAGIAGAAIVLGSDVLLRAMISPDTAVAIPTGVVTSIVGAAFLVVIAMRSRDTGQASVLEGGQPASRRATVLVGGGLILVLCGVVVNALLLGDSTLLVGDLVNWATGRAGPSVSYILDTRVPRVLAALCAGSALALAGTAVQAVTRNPLADPGLLGVSGGAGLGAVLLVTTVPTVSSAGVAGAALLGAGLAAVVVFGLAARGGFRQNRLVLVGIGVSSGLYAVISLVIVLTDPFDKVKALTWLSGSTYGRTYADVVPVAIVTVLALAFVLLRRRELDLVSLDEDTPRLLGVGLGRTRLQLLVLAVALTGTAVSAIGTVGFVGLVAPHAARALVGRSHARVAPVAVGLGAALVCISDLLGRSVIAPAQLGAGILAAVIGTPYFVWLLIRTPNRG